MESFPRLFSAGRITEAFVRGPGVAEWLAERGCRVDLVTPDFHIAALVWRDMLQSLLTRLARAGVRILPSTLLTWISPNAVRLRDRMTHEERELSGIETVVLVTGNHADDGLYFALKGRGRDLHRIGDCRAPGLADRAVYDGHRVAREL